MADLDAYRAKRRFLRTPEPVGGEDPALAPEGVFVVQQHGAARPHFDLRLALGGALKSWALPEGPTLDPAQRRLAIATEDHPLDYARFEGVIPAGCYGAGPMIVWDRGDWAAIEEDAAAALEAGALKFRLAGAKLAGGFMLKRLKGAEWLLIKERDPSVSNEDLRATRPESVLSGLRLDELPSDTSPPCAALGAPAPLPRRFAPQLPSPAPTPPEGAEWLHEIKYDGYRTLAFLERGAVRLATRNGLDWTERYGPLADAVGALDCASAVIDGEVVVQDARGAASLENLQQALSDGRLEALVFYVFDLVHLDGRDLTGEPLETRKRALRRLAPFDPAARVQFSDHVVGGGQALFAEICRLGLEGVVSKRAAAPYRPGRGAGWLKAKRYDVAVFEVVGFTTKASDAFIASLILAERDGAALRHVGRAGSGLSNEAARALFERFSAQTIAAAPIAAPKIAKAQWIAPGAAQAEIAYRGRSAEGVIRHASILAVRERTAPARARASARPRLVADADLAAIRLTNPDRAYADGTTKLDLALYYARAGDWMLPGLLDRPVTLLRCPSGDFAECFHQRRRFSGLPDGVEAQGSGDAEGFLAIRNARGFLGLVQFGAVEFHPWDCRLDDLDRPDRLTIDLDPGEGVGWPVLRAAAEAVRDRLAAAGLTGFLKRTGGAGLHVVAPLARRQDWAAVRRFLKAFAAAAAADAPWMFTTSSAKGRRKGVIYLDMGRTNRGSSSIAACSLRARPGFPAAAPLAWEETPTAPVFNRQEMAARLESLQTDPWQGFDDARAAITRAARRSVGLDR